MSKIKNKYENNSAKIKCCRAQVLDSLIYMTHVHTYAHMLHVNEFSFMIYTQDEPFLF